MVAVEGVVPATVRAVVAIERECARGEDRSCNANRRGVEDDMGGGVTVGVGALVLSFKPVVVCLAPVVYSDWNWFGCIVRLVP